MKKKLKPFCVPCFRGAQHALAFQGVAISFLLFCLLFCEFLLTACDGPYKKFSSEAGSASVTETYVNDDYTEAWSFPSEGATFSASLQESSVAGESKQEASGYTEQLPDAAHSVEPKRARIQNRVVPNFFPKKKVFSFAAFLLFAALITGGLKGFFSRKEEEGQAEEWRCETRVGVTRESSKLLIEAKDAAALKLKCEKLQDLLPIAGKLALAVNTPGAYDLLTTAQQNIKNAVSEQVGNTAYLNKCYIDAVTAFRTLHQSALEQGSLIFNASKSLAALPSLALWEADTTAAILLGYESGAEKEAVQALLKTFRSLKERNEALFASFNEKTQQLLSLKMFENEKDKDSLLAAANILNDIQVDNTHRSHLATYMQEISSCVMEGAKLNFLQNIECKLRERETVLAAIRLRFALALDAEEGGDYSLLISNKEESEKQVKLLTEYIRDASNLLVQISAEAKEMRKGGSMQAVVGAKLRAQAVDEELRSLLQKCGNIITQHFPPRSEKMNHVARRLIIGITTKTVNYIMIDNVAISTIVKDLQEAAKDLTSFSASPFRKEILHQVATNSEAMIAESAQRAFGVAALISQLKEVTESSKAFEQIQKINELALKQTATKNAAQKLKTAAKLLVLLDRELENSDGFINDAADHVSNNNEDSFIKR